MLVSDLDDDPGDLKNLAGVRARLPPGERFPVRIVALNPQPRDAGALRPPARAGSDAAAGAAPRRALAHDRRAGARRCWRRSRRSSRSRSPPRALGGAAHLEARRDPRRRRPAPARRSPRSPPPSRSTQAGGSTRTASAHRRSSGRSAEHLLGAGRRRRASEGRANVHRGRTRAVRLRQRPGSGEGAAPRPRRQLADVASTARGRAASQADDLLGVLAWGGTRAPDGRHRSGRPSGHRVHDAARLDPSNVDAAFNLELALRSLESTGVRNGPSPSSGPRGTGHSGAGAGTPGSGY